MYELIVSALANERVRAWFDVDESSKFHSFVSSLEVNKVTLLPLNYHHPTESFMSLLIADRYDASRHGEFLRTANHTYAVVVRGGEPDYVEPLDLPNRFMELVRVDRLHSVPGYFFCVYEFSLPAVMTTDVENRRKRKNQEEEDDDDWDVETRNLKKVRTQQQQQL